MSLLLSFSPPAWWPQEWAWKDDGTSAWCQTPWLGARVDLLTFMDDSRAYWHRRPEEIVAAARALEDWDDWRDDDCGVYFLVRGREIVYVGLSCCFAERLERHIKDGREWDMVFLLPIFERGAMAVEGYYIKTLRPPENANLSRVGKLLWDWKP